LPPTPTLSAVAGLSQAELVEMVMALAGRVESLEAENLRLRAELAKNSGNSSKPPSRDPAAERSRQAEARRAKRSRDGKVRRPGKQPGGEGTTLAMVENPDEIIVHAPKACGGCGGSLADAEVTATARRQVVDLPVVAPSVTEHQAQTRRCACCDTTTAAAFPDGVRAPVSYGPRVKAIVVYLLARQHIPVGRAQEAMADLFGLKVSAGTVDACYAEAGRRLKGFIAALVAFLRTLPVLHADETTDRIGTVTCWMHVVSTASFTLIHASATRGFEAVRTAGVLIGYRGVIVHDRLALYWKLTTARHGICSAHLLRDLAQAATVATQKTWAEGLAGLLVEINTACDDARARGLKTLAPNLRNAFNARYDHLVAAALAANPDPPAGRKRDALARQSYNLATAFATHKKPILAFMNNLAVGMTNNQAERDLRPVKLHRKISSCFKSQAGAERFAHVRSYLSTTPKHDIPALDALTDLFTGNPWMPPQPQAA
jgi:transposase